MSVKQLYAIEMETDNNNKNYAENNRIKIENVLFGSIDTNNNDNNRDERKAHTGR